MNVNKPIIDRQYLKTNIKLNAWEDLLPYFEELKNRVIDSLISLEIWLKNKSELETFIQEDCGWRYIKMTCDTNNEDYSNSFNYFINEIEPKIAPYSNDFNIKLISCVFTKELKNSSYILMLKGIEQSIKLFREENIALQAQMQTLQNDYGSMAAQMTIEHNAQEITLQQAAKFFKEPDRKLREEIYFKIATRRSADKEKLNNLLDKLISLRSNIADNAGYKTYTDYKYDELHRFDYNQHDVINLHKSVSKHITPIIEQFQKERKEKLAVDTLRPWDMDVNTKGTKVIAPFSTAKELIEKTIACFKDIDTSFADYIITMQTRGYLDLDSRKGKAHGGYNYPLYESNIPFIFMNAAGTMRDVETMVHEGGHAIHCFLSAHLPLTDFKNIPSEVAELASMSMELIAMEYFSHFIKDSNELKQIKKEQLQSSLETLVWVCTIDKFQHWLYNNPTHTHTEREDNWVKIYNEFNPNILDNETTHHEKDMLAIKKIMWQKQLHIYEVPFYYIEYGMAQIGAIALWRQYKQNKQSCISNYKAALTLGYSKTIPEIYETAGIKFDFSENYILELANFIKTELNNIA